MMVKKYDVTVVGELNVDLILNQLNRLPAMGKEVLAEELFAFTGTDNMQTAFAAIKGQTKTLVVKDGTCGAYLFDGLKIIHQPAFNHNLVVDSVGAGDSFNAGFIHYFLRGKTAAECLAYGTLTGAISTTCAGGTGAFTNMARVQEIAHSAFNFTHS
jgi:sugar/nucleoside kinase (ribokinase family)